MTDPRFLKKYIDLIRSGDLTRQDRLILAGGTMPNGTPTPPVILGMLFHDKDQFVRDEASESILKLSEPDLRQLAMDNNSSAELLMFLATHFHDSPSIGVSIIGNKNITLDILKILQGKDDDVGSMELNDAVSHEELIEAGYRDVEESYDSSMLDSMVVDEDEMFIEIEMGDDEVGPETGRPDRSREGQSTSPSISLDSGGTDEEIVFERHDAGALGGGSATADRQTGRSRADDATPVDDEIPIEEDDITIDEGLISEKDQFSETVDHIERRFDDVFDFDSITGAEGEGGSLKDDLNIVPEPQSIENVISSAKKGRRETAAPTIRDGDAEVTLATEKFVTRIPKQRYYYKAGLMEVLAPVVKIAIPIVVVLIIFAVYWISVPKEPPTVEDFEAGVNRNLINGKTFGFNSKLPIPLPDDSTILSWKYLNASEETEIVSGKLRGEMESFITTYEVEIGIEELKASIEANKRELNNRTNRQNEVAKNIETLNTEIAALEEVISNDNLNEQDIEDERQAELTAFKGEFAELEDRYLQLEEDIVDVKRRLAVYDGPIGEDESPGHVANKIEFETLSKELEKITPEYNEYKADYQNIVNGINRKYDILLDNIETLKESKNTLRSFKQEQLKNTAYIENSKTQIDSLSKELKTLEKSPERGPALKGANLSNFLMLNYFLVEKMTSQDEEVSSFLRYTIYKRVANVEVTNEFTEGEKEISTYAFTFMRMETYNKVLFFKWNFDSTTWVLTGIINTK